jgi:hypothetical protein
MCFFNSSALNLADNRVKPDISAKHTLANTVLENGSIEDLLSLQTKYK